MERLRKRWNCYDFQHFINGVKKENPRHIAKQLRAIKQFLEAEDPDRSLVAEVMKECCRVYTLVRASRSLPGDEAQVACPAVGVQYKDMTAYSKAF